MADIAHVVVLMLENRSYDHLLGYVPHPDPSFDGLLGRACTNPGWGRGPAVAASPEAKQVLPVPAAVPAYYEPFLAQAAQVQQHLAAVGEPEVATPATGPPADQGAQITRRFAAAAGRHRGAH